jgi:hypothetical protein
MKPFLKSILIVIALLVLSNVVHAQYAKEYFTLIAKADSLFKAKAYEKSGLSYSAAFRSNGSKGSINDRYEAARAWALANIPDSAFFQLYRISRKAFFHDYERVLKEDDFKSLYSDKRWEQLIDLMKQNGEFNFGFERVYNFESIPPPWFEWGTKDFLFRIDSSVKHTGKYSLRIEATEDIKDKSFGCPAFAIPADFEGKKIEVRAYMKMEKVDQPIGLLLRIDGPDKSNGGKNTSLAFDNMQGKGIKGTSDWTLYTVKLKYPKGAKTIYVGAIMAGTGKLWVDDFQLFIDGKEIKAEATKIK